MDKKYNSQTWVGNMYKRFEAVRQEVDEFVSKDAIKYVENHMQNVGDSVKKFYSGVVQEILPPLVDPVRHVAPLIPSKPIDLVDTCTSSAVSNNENTVNGKTTKSEEASLVPTEKCHQLATTGPCHSVQIRCAVSGYPTGEADDNLYFQQEVNNQIQKTPAKAIQINSSTNSQEDFVVEQFPCKDVSSTEFHKNSSEASIYCRCIDGKCDDDHFTKFSSEDRLDNRSFEEEGIFCNRSSQSDNSVFEDADWGIEDVIDLNLAIDKKSKGEQSPSPSEDVNVSADRIWFVAPSVEEKSEKVPMETLVSGLGINCSQEKNTLLNRSIDEFESDTNTASVRQSYEREIAATCNENEEKACHILTSELLPDRFCDSSNSFKNSSVEPDTIYCNPAESMDVSHGLSSCGSCVALGCDSNNDTTRLASSSCALSHDTTKTDEAASGSEMCRSKHGQYCNLAQFEASVPCSKIGAADGSTIDIEGLNMDTIDLSDRKKLLGSCVVVKGEKLFTFPSWSRSKSYKKIIQDAFTSRKRLTNEYKQLAIWYGDMDKELSELTEENAPPDMGKSPAQDSPDSEWELL